MAANWVTLDAALFGETKHHEGGRLADAIEAADGFAQVYPEHKYHIVEILQNRGHVVGMTGDGVNDAPALKKADAGIAVSGATDAARSAADMVLLSPGLSVIIKAIQESRKIFQRMQSYAIYRIAETIRVLLFMTLSILVFNFYPVTAVMIVLLVLLNDGAVLSIAYDRVRYSNEPEVWNMRIVLAIASILGVAGVFASNGGATSDLLDRRSGHSPVGTPSTASRRGSPSHELTLRAGTLQGGQRGAANGRSGCGQRFSPIVSRATNPKTSGATFIIARIPRITPPNPTRRFARAPATTR